MTRLCLNMIVRNESAIIDRCLDAAAPFIDCWVICDTGSTDGTPSRIERRMASWGIPGELRHVPFVDFGQARNAALDEARASRLPFDYLLLADADMTLIVDDPGFRDRLEADAYLVRQQNDLAYWNARLLRRDVDARYVGVTHEYLSTPDPPGRLQGIRFHDHANGANRVSKSERDIALLAGELSREPGNVRSMFYLAQSLKDSGRWRDAIAWYERRIAAGGWDEEVWYSRAMIALCHRDLGSHAEFVRCALEAYNARLTRAEPLAALAKVYRERAEHEACLMICEVGQEIPEPSDALFVDQTVYREAFRHEISVSGFYSVSPRRRLAGRTACFELTTDPDVGEPIRATARRNAAYYAPLAAEMFGSFRSAPLLIPLHAGYAAMNPSIAIHGDDRRCVVRTVNYRLQNGAYLIDDPGGVVRTVNWMARLAPSYEIERVERIEEPTPQPFVAGSPVRGFEDCRLVRREDAWWLVGTARDQNPEARCEVAVLRMGDDRRISGVHIQRSQQPQLHQKNWVPIVDGNELRFVYWTGPTTILRYDDATGQAMQECESPTRLAVEHLRGGSQALRVDAGWLYVVHEPTERQNLRGYLHRFVLLGDDYAFVAMTDPFCFLGPGIKFCAGLARDPRSGELVVSFGVNDAEAWLGFVDEAQVLAALRPDLASGFTPVDER